MALKFQVLYQNMTQCLKNLSAIVSKMILQKENGIDRGLVKYLHARAKRYGEPCIYKQTTSKVRKYLLTIKRSDFFFENENNFDDCKK